MQALRSLTAKMDKKQKGALTSLGINIIIAGVTAYYLFGVEIGVNCNPIDSAGVPEDMGHSFQVAIALIFSTHTIGVV